MKEEKKNDPEIISNQLAPILLIGFNRPIHFQKTLLALRENEKAKQSTLYISIDGPRNEDDIKMKYWVRLFNNYDLYSKENIEVEINKLKTYYFNLFLKFFNNDDKIYI